ncbi:hypothetical protein LMG28138_02817 [Pararobbsia alpina]|uniref:Uncharacterized protein n=1 Tax=Pararobbsia alpina TaxID=621374 RepID=A0A6S7B8L3_9BURK|nr:hypothetical protein LMG28138_02817 [Pararobbsia alpina]
MASHKELQTQIDGLTRQAEEVRVAEPHAVVEDAKQNAQRRFASDAPVYIR